jgi:DNA-binding transcriptional MerR regulator
MTSLSDLAQQSLWLSLDAFVALVKDLLPQFLPEGEDSQSQGAISSRLVRYYTTQGWLDKPLRQGREARYTYRHLLQLLLIRRLLAEGYGGNTIISLMKDRSDQALRDSLEGGVQLTMGVANPALAFLAQLRSGPNSVQSGPRSVPVTSTPESSSAPAALKSPSETWQRLVVLPGLELQVRQDFVFPATAYEQEQLLRLIADRLAALKSSFW